MFSLELKFTSTSFWHAIIHVVVGVAKLFFEQLCTVAIFNIAIQMITWVCVIVTRVEHFTH